MTLATIQTQSLNTVNGHCVHIRHTCSNLLKRKVSLQQASFGQVKERCICLRVAQQEIFAQCNIPVLKKARSAGLLTGLAGSLRQEDAAPLLTIGPDYLGFRGALCLGSNRSQNLHAAAFAKIRNAIQELESIDPWFRVIRWSDPVEGLTREADLARGRVG